MPLIKIGENAPGFTLPNQDGMIVSKDDFSGRYVLLWWYPKADTPGWTIEGKGFRDRIQNFDEANTVILGISYDTCEANKVFKEKFMFPFDLLSDESGQVSIAYGVSTQDSTRSPRKSVLIAPDGKIAISYDEVIPAEHSERVLSDINSLGWLVSVSNHINGII